MSRIMNDSLIFCYLGRKVVSYQYFVLIYFGTHTQNPAPNLQSKVKFVYSQSFGSGHGNHGSVKVKYTRLFRATRRVANFQWKVLKNAPVLGNALVFRDASILRNAIVLGHTSIFRNAPTLRNALALRSGLILFILGKCLAQEVSNYR